MQITRALKPSYFYILAQVLLILLFFIGSSYANCASDQDTLSRTNLNYFPWEIGFSGGISRFITTINPNKEAPFKKFNYWNSDINPAFSLSVIKNLTPTLSGEFEWVNTKLSGSWNRGSGYPVPPLAIAQGLTFPQPFKTGINEFDLMLNVNMKRLTSLLTKNEAWQIYIKGGIGLDVLKDYSALYHFDLPRNGIDYTILYGLGVGYQIARNLKLKLNVLMSRVVTDRLDGIREIKPGQSVTGTNPFYFYNLKERYVHPSLGISYTFERKRKVVKFIQVRDSIPKLMTMTSFNPLPVQKKESNLLLRLRPSIVGKVYNFYYGVGFGYDKSDLTSAALADIDRLGFELATNPSVHAIIKGHTDSRGSAAYNLKLSAKRAQAVIDYLVKLGIKASRLHNRPLGESQPVNKCVDGVKCTEAEYALNRRTEILIVESEIKLDIEQNGKESIKTTTKTSALTTESTGGQYITEIQVGAYGTLASVEKAKKMLGLLKDSPGLSVVSEDKLFKVRIIGFASRAVANNYLLKVQSIGFPDARLVQVKEP